MIIDIHTHIFPDALAARAVALLAERAGTPPRSDGTSAGLLASMRRSGVDRAVIAPVATKPSQVRTINDSMVELHRQHPELICFGSLHPQQKDWEQEIDRLVAGGIPGIKLHPDYQSIYADDPCLLPIYRALARAGRILLMHTGVDIGLPPPVHGTPDRVARVLDAVPELTLIAAHMGGYDQWDDVERYLIGRELYLDTSFSRADLGEERMVAMIHAHGSGRILFGTDSPWTDQAEEVAGIRAMPLTEAEKEAILGGNALRLLGEAAA